jgi:Ca2+-binding EF-hand superfamily protein
MIRITPPVKHVLTDSEIDFLFNDMDTDKNGTLCMDEFTSFCLGRFTVTKEVAKSIFEANDVDKNSVIDRKEFGLVFKKLENAVNSHRLRCQC